MFPPGQCRPPKIIYCLSLVGRFVIVLDVPGRAPAVAALNRSAMTQKSATAIPDVKDTGEEKIEAGERKLKLLIIEDDEKILEAITEYFSRTGYTVQTAEDGLSGVQAALNDRPDAIVLDLMLPKMDGLAVCRELREKAAYIPILMLTAKDDVVDKVLGLEMGADDYITKPFSLRELEARITLLMRASSSRKLKGLVM